MTLARRNAVAHILIGSILSLAASTASAILVDYGTTTVDTDTNLEWLDLTQTLNLSYADALTSSFVTVDGYRSATSLEVADLFTNAGVSVLDNGRREIDFAPASDLVNLLGCTLTPAVCATSPNLSGTGFAEWSPGSGRRALYAIDGINGGRGGATIQSSFLTAADPAIGTFLVRVVPEPSTSLLLLGGLAVLSANRRQRDTA